MILFVTFYLKYAVDAYELSVFHYIPKSELEKHLDRAIVDAFQMMMLQAEKRENARDFNHQSRENALKTASSLDFLFILKIFLTKPG